VQAYVATPTDETVKSFADRWRDFGSQRQVEQALQAISADSLALVDAELDKLQAIDDKLAAPDGAQLRIQAKKVGSIELPGGDEIMYLRSLAKQSVGRISITLGIAIAADVYSSGCGYNESASGYGPGDNWLPHG
jgi:hypothetical protein